LQAPEQTHHYSQFTVVEFTNGHTRPKHWGLSLIGTAAAARHFQQTFPADISSSFDRFRLAGVPSIQVDHQSRAGRRSLLKRSSLKRKAQLNSPFYL
jgi:hypothetical protein